MAIKRTYINADEELVIKGKLTIEGNVTQIESTQQVTNLEGNVFTINSDGDPTTAQLKLNSNNNFGTLDYTYAVANVNTGNGLIVVEPGLKGNLHVGAGQKIVIDGGGEISGAGANIDTSGTAGSANSFVSDVQINITNNVIATANFIGSGNVVNLNATIKDSGVTSGTYGNAVTVGQFQVAPDGRITTAIPVAIDHDALLNFVADEHIDHSSVTLTAGAGLTGGGDITASRSFDIVGGYGLTINANNIEVANSDIRNLFSASNGIDYNSSTGAFQAVELEIQHDSLDGFVADEHIAHSGVTLTAGTGLTGGGDITASRTFNVVGGDGITANANDIQVDSTVVRITGTQTISGDKTFTGNVDLSGAGTIAGFTVDGDLAVSGNIQATGNLNTVNQIDLIVDDSNITLNNGNVAQDSHIKIDRSGGTGSDTYLKWNETDDRWQFSNDGSTDNDMLLLSDFSATSPITFSSGVIAINNPITEDFVFAGNLEVQGNLIVGPDAIEDVHESFYVNTNGALTYTHNASGAYYAVAKGDGIVLTANTVAVGAGDGITVNANDIQVDSTVIRTTGDQSIGNIKTFTGELVIPGSSSTTANAIYSEGSEAFIYISGTGPVKITPSADVGEVEDVGATGTDIYAGYRSVPSGNANVKYHGIKSIDSGTYTTISEASNVITLDGDISAIRGAFSPGGDLSYNSATGEFSFTERTDSEVRGLISGTGLISYNSGTGVISTTADNYASWDFDTDTGSPQSVSSGGTVTIQGGTGIDVTHSGSTITVTNTNDADITGVTAGSGLIGGGSSGTVTLNIGAGDGITVNADNVTVDSSVVRTSGNQSIGGDKTLTGSTQINSLNVNGAYSFPTADGTINEVLTTNGSGTLAFQPVSAIGLTSVTGGDGLTATVGVGTTELDVVGGYGITVNADNIELNNTNVRALFTGSSGVNYNSGTGAITADSAEIRSFFSGSNGVDYNSSTGAITADSAEIRALFSAGGDLSYNSTTGEFSFTNDAGDIESVEVLAGVGLSGGGSATSGAFSTTLALDLDELTTSTTNGDGDYFAVVDTAGNQKKLTKGSIDISGFNNDIGFSTTTGTVTSVSGGSGLTGSVTTSGSLAVGAGSYILVGANDVGVDATSTNTANKVVARDGSGNFAAGTITATATQAQYADLAENYETDSDYEPGTVLILGGDKEVTVTDEPGSFKAMGVVSTDPAHLMNVDCEGEHVVAVALRGRIPCKVAGTCKKGDVLITSDTPGHAMVAAEPEKLSPLQIIGRALEHKTSAAPGVVEIIV